MCRGRSRKSGKHTLLVFSRTPQESYLDLLAGMLLRPRGAERRQFPIVLTRLRALSILAFNSGSRGSDLMLAGKSVALIFPRYSRSPATCD